MPCYVHWGIVKVALAKAQQISNVFSFLRFDFHDFRFDDIDAVDAVDDELWRSSQLPLSRPIHAGARCRWPPGFNNVVISPDENVVKDGKHGKHMYHRM